MHKIHEGLYNFIVLNHSSFDEMFTVVLKLEQNYFNYLRIHTATGVNIVIPTQEHFMPCQFCSNWSSSWNGKYQFHIYQMHFLFIIFWLLGSGAWNLRSECHGNFWHISMQNTCSPCTKPGHKPCEQVISNLTK